MSYLLDKKEKRKKFLNIAFGVVIFIFLFYFRLSIFNGFSYISQTIFRPILSAGNSVGEKFGNSISYFLSKNSLYVENQNLQSQIKEEEVRMANYDSIVAENASLKEILGRKNEKTAMILAAILSKPNKSIYDTLLIDAGIKEGVKVGDTVFALGDVPVGRVDIVYDNSSKVVLFSNSGETTQATISNKNVFMDLVGRGGGNFEMILPRDFVLQKGDQALMPGSNAYVLAIAETVISDPRDPFTKALLRSPVNIQELKFVEVKP